MSALHHSVCRAARRRLIILWPLTLAPAVAGAQAADSVPPDTVYLMPDIVTTAARTPRVAQADNPTATSTLVVRAEGRAAGLVAVDLLRELPGTHVQQTSAGQGAVVLRGLIGNQVLLLVNGIPLNNGTYRDGPGQYLATIDPETIERVEIMRGPASVWYGSDAQGGAVNVITRPHPARPGWSLRESVSATSATEGARARLSAGFGGSLFSLSAGATLLQAGNLQPGGGRPRQNPTGFHAEGVDLRAEFRPAGTHAVAVGIEHFGMRDVPRYDRYVTFRAPSPGVDAEHVFDPQIRQLGYVRHRWEPRHPGVASLETTVSVAIQREGRRRQRLVNDLPATSIEYTRDDVYTPGVSVVGTSMLQAGGLPVQLTWGAEAYRDRTSSRGREEDLVSGTSTPITRQTAAGSAPSGRFPDAATMLRAGVFLELEADVVQRVRLSAGGRWSGFRTRADVGTAFGGPLQHTATTVTGQVGAVLRLAGPMRLAFRLAQGFRAPNLYDLTTVGAVPGGIVLPNPNAEPEESVSYEGSLRWIDRRTAATVTAFRTVIDGFIDRVPGTFQGDTLFGGERVFVGTNAAQARLHGLELEAVHAAGPLEARATLLFTTGNQTFGDGTEEPMAKIPPLQGGASLRWRSADRRFALGYALAWAARQDRLAARDLVDPRIPPGGTPGYAVHSLSADVRITRTFTAGAGLGNIGNALYRTHASGVDSPGRHLWIGVVLLDGL